MKRLLAIEPLIVFRTGFGLLMFISLARFWWRGWIEQLYVLPRFHFTYSGFEWVQPFSAPVMYVLFGVILLSALLVAVGLLYRVAIVVFFLGFTYVELIDSTTYLNHYYFISLVAFLMIWLPANKKWSGDVYFRITSQQDFVPAIAINTIRFQLAVVYVFAGLAKLNADWMLRAIPMRIWLPGTTHVMGNLMYESWVAYLFSWFGAFYDLFIVFFLINKRTRPVAYVFVLIFHLATAIFFPGIGLFPYVMIVSSLVFFDYKPGVLSGYSLPAVTKALVVIYVVIQLVVPMRFLLYPGHLFWHEEGYRFSWRVMLMEKSGAAYFTVRDPQTKQQVEVNNAAFLTPLQEKMMSTQPDMIVKYAHHLASAYKKQGMVAPEVYGDVYVALNGERSRPFIDSTVNLAAERTGWQHYTWILPYDNEKVADNINN
jgi:hypothetical protein